MLFKTNLDYNLNFNESINIRRLNSLKFGTNDDMGALLKKISIYFLFRNVVDLDSIFLQRYVLLLWLCFGEVSKIFKYKKVLRLGVRYSRFCLGFSRKNKKNLNILNFLNERLLPVLNSKYIDLFIEDKNMFFCLKDLSLFTGLKLAPGVFFVRILEPLYIRLFFNTYLIKLSLSFYKLFFKWV